MSSSKFNQMFKFISQYKYEINKNFPDNLKCGKCKNILINAYCVPCGCSYCCDCMNEMSKNGVENCPGKTEDCKDELISNNLLDYKTNKAVSNVVIKCPEEMCLYECAVISMEEHVRVCENKSIKCPFANLGCDGKKIGKEMMNDHCQSANFNHCKILIEIIDNMRNEIDIFNQLNIQNLEKKLKSKDETIDKMNETIDLLKLENQTYKQEFDSFKQSLVRKFEEIDDKMIIENDNGKIEKEEYKREFDNINENLEKKTNKIYAEILQEKQARVELINDKTTPIKAITIERNKKSEMLYASVNVLNKMIESNYPLIEWTIDKFDEKRKKGERIMSEYFTGIIKQYKLQLSCYTNGYGDYRGKGCSIYLDIYSGVNDEFLSWPFTADVTIKISNKTNSNINKSIFKYCKIDKPRNKLCNQSNAFNYLYCDLVKIGEKLDNCFVVECFIVFK